MTSTKNEPPVKVTPNSDADKGQLGIRIEPLTPELAAQLKLRSGTQGVVVQEVDPEGPAAEAGIQ
ncbi:MAG: hypothetical protein ACRD9R_07015 [Pyrinomonadaceae bacterium]